MRSLPLIGRAFENLDKWPVAINIEHLIYNLIFERGGITNERLTGSSIDYKVAATSSKGDLRFFSNRTWIDMLRAQHGSMCLPVLDGRYPIIGETPEDRDGLSYIDTDISASHIPLVRAAIADGHRKVLTLGRTCQSSFINLFYNTWILLQTSNFRKKHAMAMREYYHFARIMREYGNFTRAMKKEDRSGLSGVEVCTIAGDQSFRSDPLDNSYDSLRRGFDNGYNRAKGSVELTDFLERVA